VGVHGDMCGIESGCSWRQVWNRVGVHGDVWNREWVFMETCGIESGCSWRRVE
jgi:hypothetical protein